MSIGILLSVHDGIVLAADSASTLMLVQSPQTANQANAVALNVYNNANKIANLYKGASIGCVAYGAGSIGNASISTLLKDFRRRITKGEASGFSLTEYTMQGVAELLTGFLMQHVDQLAPLPPSVPMPSLGILLGGYSAGKSLGEGWIIEIENGKAKPPRLLREAHEIGITWGGEGEAIARLILGFSQNLPQVLQTVIAPEKRDVIDQLLALLKPTLQAPVVFAPMPIQDAIDLAEFLVHTAIMYSRFVPGPQTVGGPIEIAAITKHEGFKWVRRKYYFSDELNPEPHNDD